MEGERQPPAVASAAASKVLDNDDLLIEILLRTSFPTTLVRTALVCRRWLWHVSEPAFLRCFRKLHPPRLLGFYVNPAMGRPFPRFVPMLPQPPELAAIINRACFCMDTWPRVPTGIINCRNGRIFNEYSGESGFTFGVHSPLCAERGIAVVPPYPTRQLQDRSLHVWHELLSKEGDDVSYFYLLIESTEERTKFTAHLYMLQDGVWCTHNTLATDQPFRPFLPLRQPKSLFVDNKIYIAAGQRKIVVLDLTVSSFSTINIPQGVEYGDRDTMFSWPDDASGVYLIQAKAFQLRIWHHKCDNWLLVDTISLREMFANLRVSDCSVEDENIHVLRIYQVGDNAEFVFFEMGRDVLYLDIKCRTLRKVYEMTKEDHPWAFSIHHFKMIWPPKFPANRRMILQEAEMPCEEQGYHEEGDLKEEL